MRLLGSASDNICANAATATNACTPIVDLINTWIHIGQALVGSIGALAFIFAFLCMP